MSQRHGIRRLRAATLGLAALAAGLGGCATDDPCAGGVPDPGVVCTLAGSGEGAFNGDGLDALATDLYSPTSVRVGPDGTVFVADSNNQRIRALTPGGAVRTVAGNGVHDPAHIDYPAIESPLENPVDLGFDPDGQLVIVSLHDPRLLILDADGMLRRIAGMGEYGDSGDGGRALDARFFEPSGIAVAPDGTVYIADGLAARVRAIEPDGTMRAVAGNGEYGYAGDGAPAVDAMLDYPTALALDDEGRVLIADSANHVVRRVEHDGTMTTLAGVGERGFAGDGGLASQAALDSPEGLAVADDGSIYVADTRNHRIRRIDSDGTIDTVAGTGDAAWRGDGDLALDAAFSAPKGISLSGGVLYIADQHNARVRVIGVAP